MSILVVSKSFIVREALDVFFNQEFKGHEVQTLKEITDVNKKDLPQVEFMLVDIESDKVEPIGAIKKVFQSIKIMFFDSKNNNRLFLQSVKMGIEGYITDMQSKDDLLYIVKRILSGKKHYDVELLDAIICEDNNNSFCEINTLTEREQEVLQKVREGLTNKEIAEELYVTQHTVKKHITNILSKLDMRNRKELIIYSNKIYNKAI